MSCEKYQDALTNLAAKGAEPAGDVRAHLESCVACSSYMEQEDVAAHGNRFRRSATVNAGLPAVSAPALQARIAQDLISSSLPA